MKEIRITIDLLGNVTIETAGFTGQECKEKTAALQAKLGATTSDTETAEFYAQPIEISEAQGAQ